MFWNMIDWFFFIVLAFCVCYLFVFAFASLFYHEKTYPKTTIRHRFLVLFPAYAEDNVIISSVTTFLRQDYPKEYYEVVVISDHQKEKTERILQQLPITTLIATYTDSSKAKALILAVNTVKGPFDTVVILDADNLAPSYFLSELNKIRAASTEVIQVHRKGIVNESPISVLDNISEEINNGFFRKGHQALGLSSALTGSGMTFDYNWFKQHIKNASTAGEDKELEAMLLRQKIPIVYSDKLFIWDRKTDKKEAIGNQRKRWIAAQLYALKTNLPHLFYAVISLNVSYTDKIIQWMLPPRLVQLTFVFGITLLTVLLFPSVSPKWIGLSLLQITAMLLPIPKECRNKKLFRALAYIPILSFRTFINLFRLKGINKKFIHTEHK